MATRNRSKERRERVMDAAVRAIGVARTGVPLRAAIADTAVQSGFDATEIAQAANEILDTVLMAVKK